MSAVRISLLADCRNHLGEGPLWDVREQRLYWVDSTACAILSCREDGSALRVHYVPGFIGSMALRESGGAVLALADGFWFYAFDTQKLVHLGDPEAGRATRFNDGKVDRAGRFFAGTMGLDFDPCDVSVPRRPGRDGALWRLDPDLTIHRVETGLICSNAPCWSPDNRIFYFGDSEDALLWAYDYDIRDGTIANRRVFASDRDHARTVDGATVDSEGFVWNAKVLGGRVIRYAPDGRIDRVVEMPVRNVTSVMFGGRDLDVLFVTSMGRPVRGVPQQEPGAGGVFAIRGLGVRGLPEPRFAG